MYQARKLLLLQYIWCLILCYYNCSLCLFSLSPLDLWILIGGRFQHETDPFHITCLRVINFQSCINVPMFMFHLSSPQVLDASHVDFSDRLTNARRKGYDARLDIWFVPYCCCQYLCCRNMTQRRYCKQKA